MNYSEKLLDPRWQKKRLEVFNRDNWRCIWCGEKDKTLHVHHSKYAESGNPWDVENIHLESICEECHMIEHLEKPAIIKEIWEVFVCFHQGEPVKSLKEIILQYMKNG